MHEIVATHYQSPTCQLIDAQTRPLHCDVWFQVRLLLPNPQVAKRLKLLVVHTMRLQHITRTLNLFFVTVLVQRLKVADRPEPRLRPRLVELLR